MTEIATTEPWRERCAEILDRIRERSPLVHNIAKNVANLDHRVKVDGPKPDPQGQCRQ